MVSWLILEYRPKNLCPVCQTTITLIPKAAGGYVPKIVLKPSGDQSYHTVNEMAIEALSCKLCRLMFTSMVVDELTWSKHGLDWLHNWTPVIELLEETRSEQYLVFRPSQDLQARYGIGIEPQHLDDMKQRMWDREDKKRVTVRSRISAYSISRESNCGLNWENFLGVTDMTIRYIS
jgi:hypothetical protein